MAAMLFTKSAIFNLSKSVYRKNASLPLRPKVSRVCFASASKEHNPADDNQRRDYEVPETREMKEKAKETGERAVGEATDSAKQRAKEMGENTKEKAEKMADETKDAAGAAAEGARETTKGAADAARGLGEKAKQAVEGAMGAAKQTAEKIKETVVGKADEDLDEYVEKPARERRERDRSF